MGFEITFYYHPKNNGVYDMEDLQEMKKRVGEPFEDIPLTDVFRNIMKQLSRRDILVKDVKIYELVKKEISFRETKGGIVIKNKKFLLDNEDNLTVQEITEATATNGSNLPMILPPPNNKVNIVAPVGRPIKFVALDPDERNLAKVRGSGLAFLPNKRYPVFLETPDPKQFGRHIYTMLDENKREITVFDDYFLNADQKMVQGFASTVDRGETKLYGDYEKDSMPDIRGGR